MLAAFLLTMAGAAGYPRTISVDDTKPMYCLDGTNTYQPFKNTNFGRLRQAFESQYKFTATVRATSKTRGVLVFRGGVRGAETFTYTVAPYSDGLALISLRVRLKGVTEDLSGTDMCWRSFQIVNDE